MTKVQQKFRTNPLSKEEGGSTVYVKYDNGMVLAYENIKSPKAYVRKIPDFRKEAKVVKIWTNKRPFAGRCI